MRANGHDPCVVAADQPRPSASLDSPQHLCLWNRPWRPPPADTWHASTGAIGPAPTGVTWDGSLDSPIKSPHDAHPTATPRGCRLVHARAGLAPRGESLLESVRQSIQSPASPLPIDWTTTDPAPSQRRRGRPTLPELYAAMAYSGTLSAAGLEHRGSCGSPDTCSRKASPLFRFKPSSGSPAPIFPAATAIPTTTCDVPSHAQLFPPPGALCATHHDRSLRAAGTQQRLFELHRRPVTQRRVQSLLVIDLVDEARQSKPALRPGRGIPADTPLRISGFSSTTRSSHFPRGSTCGSC